ncbi:VOC family protein [Chloroflexota bacterium]
MTHWFDHFGIIVNNLDEAQKLYSNLLGLPPWDRGIVKVPEDGLQVVIFPYGDISLELIEPIDHETRFSKFLKEKGEGLFHICIFTDDFDNEVRELREKGFTLQEEDAKGPFEDHRIRLVWLPPETTRGHWIELVDAASVPK